MPVIAGDEESSVCGGGLFQTTLTDRNALSATLELPQVWACTVMDTLRGHIIINTKS